MLPSFRYVRPASLREAIQELSGPDARIHAGGTDLLGCLRDGVLTASKVVSLSSLEPLRGISVTPDGGLRVGALATLAEIAASPLVTERAAALAQGAAAAASPQLRSQGTLGGNLCQRPRCWYYRGDFDCARKGGEVCFAAAGENEVHAIFGGEGCYVVHPSDTAPALVALGAQAHIEGPGGTRSVPLEAFFVLPAQDLTRETVIEPGEILTEVVLPPPAPAQRSSYRKVRARGVWDFALAGVAVAVTATDGRVDRARIVLSGVAAAPWRSTAAERALVGHRIDAQTAATAAAAAVGGAEPLEQNGYKVDLVRAVVRESLLAMA